MSGRSGQTRTVLSDRSRRASCLQVTQMNCTLLQAYCHCDPQAVRAELSFQFPMLACQFAISLSVYDSTSCRYFAYSLDNLALQAPCDSLCLCYAPVTYSRHISRDIYFAYPAGKNEKKERDRGDEKGRDLNLKIHHKCLDRYPVMLCLTL